MAREMIVHFEPRGGGNVVDGEVFVKTLGAILDGLRSVSNALAPVMAQHRRWSRTQVREALEVGFSAVQRGSLDIAVMHGGISPHIDNQWIAAVGWHVASKAINGAAQGKLAFAEVPVIAAQSLVRAAKVARDANVNVALRSRWVKANSRSEWRTTLDLTEIEPALAKYVERQSVTDATITQLVGKLVSLDYDPPGFILDSGHGKTRVAMRAALRQKAKDNWGHEVVVTAEAKITADGKISEPKAIDILRADPEPSEDDEDSSFGLLKDALGTEQGRDYFEMLRGRS